MKARNPARDAIAIVGVGTTPYLRSGSRSPGGLAIDAAAAALRDAGLAATDVDGIVGSTSTVDSHLVQTALGIPEVTWLANLVVPFTAVVIAAAHAVASGTCDVVLAYHATYRSSGTSRGASTDALRARFGPGLNRPDPDPDVMTGPVGHAAWAHRYLQEFGACREDLGRVVINSRTHAVANPHAALRQPLTMDEYLAAPPLRYPLSRLDMDYPIDGGDALVVTTAERARDLVATPVMLHAATQGAIAGTHAGSRTDQMPGLRYTSQHVAMRHLWARSELTLADVDLFLPYDGFSISVLTWVEAAGYCGPGEGASFVADNWDSERKCVAIGGRVLLNTHGGGLSEGGVQGANHVREAVVQLQGDAGERQVGGVSAVLVTPGSFFHNAGAILLRSSR